MYRAETTDGQVVTGDHAKVDNRHYIIDKNAYIKTVPSAGWGVDAICGFREVLPSTLARSTGIKDKNGEPIFGSFPVDGVMSEGGDRVKVKDGDYTAEGIVRWHRMTARWVWVANADTINTLTIAPCSVLPLWEVFDGQYRFEGEVIPKGGEK